MYCKECGTKIADDSKFCTSCGTKQSFNPEKEIKNQAISNPNQANKSSGRKQEKEFGKQGINPGKYDYSYKKDKAPIIIGVIILIINIFVYAFNKGVSEEAYITLRVAALVLSVVITIACVKIAKLLNRVGLGWGVFAFFLPPVALIVIGLQKKKLYSLGYDRKSDAEMSKENNNIAFRLAKVKKHQEALFLANKSIDLNPNNHLAYDTRGCIKYFLKDYAGALNDLNKSIELDSKEGIKFYHRGFIYKDVRKLEEALKDWNIALEKGYSKAENAIKNNEQEV